MEITGDIGITGGGDPTESRSLSLDVGSLADGGAGAPGDVGVIYRPSTGEHLKINAADFAGQVPYNSRSLMRDYDVLNNAG